MILLFILAIVIGVYARFEYEKYLRSYLTQQQIDERNRRETEEFKNSMKAFAVGAAVGIAKDVLKD